MRLLVSWGARSEWEPTLHANKNFFGGESAAKISVARAHSRSALHRQQSSLIRRRNTSPKPRKFMRKRCARKSCFTQCEIRLQPALRQAAICDPDILETHHQPGPRQLHGTRHWSDYLAQIIRVLSVCRCNGFWRPQIHQLQAEAKQYCQPREEAAKTRFRGT